jgi:hypothetical protein
MRPGGPPRAPSAPPAGGGAPQQPGEKPPGPKSNVATAKVTTAIDQKNLKVVTVRVDLEVDRDVYEKIVQRLEPYLIRVGSEIEMTTAHPHPYQLSDPIKAYTKANQQFPQGAFKRRVSATRGNRPWPPDQRVSWMADLLPHLGYDEVYRRIRFESSWKDSDNLIPSVTLIPPFLDSKATRGSWYVRYPGMTYDVASTHFVGIAGVGLDAAEYSAGDPSVAKKLGVFGYDRVTRLSDIADGLANTIVMAQVPSNFKSPWIAGGGSTVRGVPETQSIQPFISTKYDGKRGTFVVMADGSVRFLAENTSDEVFKALCTIKGGEPTGNLDQVAPLVPPPDEDMDSKAERLEVAKRPKVEEPVAAAPPKKEKKEDKFPSDWKWFRSNDGKFDVLMPGTPKTEATTVTTDSGPTLFHSHKLTKDGVTYSVAYLDLPFVVSGDGIQKYLNSARDRYLAGTRGRLLSPPGDKNISVQGYPGREFQVRMPDERVVKTQILMIGPRFYQLEVGPLAAATPEDVTRFLSSFRHLE